MNKTELRHLIQESVTQEIQEIFGFFKKEGKGGTEKFAQAGEETTPTEQFSMATLKSLQTSKEIRAYLRRTLQELGRGHARAAYAIDDKTIIKVALTDQRSYQNANEVQNAACLGPELAVQVLEHDPNYIWIVEERIQPINKDKLVTVLNNLLGLTKTQTKLNSAFWVQQYFAAISHIINKDPETNPTYLAIHAHALQHSPWYRNFLTKTKSCKFASWDFHHANWGIRPKTNELVLLDLGFNQTEIGQEDQLFKEEKGVSSSFSLEDLKAIPDIQGVLTYCYDKLGKPSGDGQGRTVWVIDPSKIIKVLRKTTREGNQNEQEFKNSFCVGKKYAVQVLDYDLNGFKWLIEENVKTFDEQDQSGEFVRTINKVLNFEFEDAGEVADLFAGWPKLDDIRDHLMETNEWFRELMKAVEHCDVSSHDFHAGNWGIRPSTGELILIDLGF
jgi:hypothetical protein